MVLGVCGGVSYGASCCLGGEFRSEEAGLAWTAGEVDERYVPYTASEQRVIEIGLLAYGEEDSAVQADENEGDGQAPARNAAETGGLLSSGVDELAYAGADKEAGADTQPESAGNAGTAGEASVQSTDVQPDTGVGADTDMAANMDAGSAAAGQVGRNTGADVQSEENADVQTGGAAIALSAEDYEALLRIVQAEAGNEDTKGKILVANVVLNRVADERFPNTVYDVIFQRAGGKAQFSPVASGSYYKVVVSEDTREAVDRALSGEDYSEGALYFAARRYAGSSQMRWFDECLTKLFSYGGHEFFTS